MQKVSSIVSKTIGNTLTNIKTWDGVLYNVLQEGLVGGGVEDDTVALQTLINKAITAGRRTIYFPHGDNGQYYVTSLTNADQVDFVGDNCTFVGGYNGTIANFGGLAALQADFTQLEAEVAQIQEDYDKEVNKVFNVKGYGAIGNGIADDTSAIQNAIDAAFLTGGKVEVPPGKYKITSITIKQGVVLCGVENTNVSTHNGSWLYCTDTVNPAVKMFGQTSLYGIGFYHPNQVKTGTPTAYPASVEILANGLQYYIARCVFQNSYIAVKADNLHGDLIIRDCTGYPLYRGVIVDGSHSVDEFQNVNFGPNAWQYYDTLDITLNEWVAINGAAFVFGKSDWCKLINCGCWGYGYGFLAQDMPNGNVGQITILTCNFDACRNPIKATGAAWGLNILGCGVTAFDNFDATFKGVGISLNIAGDATIANSRLFSCTYKGIEILGGRNINVHDNHIEAGGLGTSGDKGCCIDVSAGSFLNIKGNYINGVNQIAYGISIGGTAAVTRVCGNQIENVGAPGSRVYAIRLLLGAIYVICRENQYSQTAGIEDTTGSIQKIIGDNQGL